MLEKYKGVHLYDVTAKRINRKLCLIPRVSFHMLTALYVVFTSNWRIGYSGRCGYGFGTCLISIDQCSKEEGISYQHAH